MYGTRAVRRAKREAEAEGDGVRCLRLAERTRTKMMNGAVHPDATTGILSDCHRPMMNGMYLYDRHAQAARLAERRLGYHS